MEKFYDILIVIGCILGLIMTWSLSEGDAQEWRDAEQETIDFEKSLDK